MLSRALVGLAFALRGCAGTQDPEPTNVEANDPCVDGAPELAELCAAQTYDDDCVGFACARTEPREALECTLDRDTDPTRFEALTLAQNPATRLYAREALLRLRAMSQAQIVLGLGDTAEVEWQGGCIAGAVLASEPAYVALLQRDDAVADALLREFLESPAGDALIFRFDHNGIRNATLAVLRERSTRPRWRGFAAEYERRLLRAMSDLHEIEPFAPSRILAQWTRDHGCERDERARQRALEDVEKARLRELERELSSSAAEL